MNPLDESLIVLIIGCAVVLAAAVLGALLI